MRIRTRLTLFLVVLQVVGVTAIASFSILFIRQYLQDERAERLAEYAGRLQVLFQNLSPEADLSGLLVELHTASGYALVGYDAEGQVLQGHPAVQSAFFPEAQRDLLAQRDAQLRHATPLVVDDPVFAFVNVRHPERRLATLRLSEPRKQASEALAGIRWIIYTGMFLSLGLVTGVSVWLARSLSRPITQLTQYAERIAGGETETVFELERKDEFGVLAAALNEMAARFRAENAAISARQAREQRFFADISHEIRNPLHSLQAALEALTQPSLPVSAQQKLGQTAHRQVLRINRLFEDLLTLQKADGDQAFVRLQPTDLYPLLAELDDEYAPEAAQRGLSWQITTPEGPLRVVADADRLRQVLHNLLQNALRYTEKGSVQLQVEQQRDQVQLRVVDTGAGIPLDHQQRIFERFYRTDEARARETGGAGLGLAVVKRILEAHASTIELKSEVGVGSTFSFYLPLAKSEAVFTQSD